MKLLSFVSTFLVFAICLSACNGQIKRESSFKEKDTVITPENNTPQYFWDHLPRPSGYTNDYEHIFTPLEKEQLNGLVAAFEKETTIQFCIVTLDSNQVTKDSFDALALRIGNIWGVGQKDKNNGVLICLSRSLRKIRINNGLGIEKIVSDETTAKILNTVFIPKFKEDKYFEGVYNGISAYCDTLRHR